MLIIAVGILILYSVKKVPPFVIIWLNMATIFKITFHPGRLLETGRLLGTLEYEFETNVLCFSTL